MRGMIDQPLLRIDQVLLPTIRDGVAGPPDARPVSLDFAGGQFHLLAGEDVAPLAR